uniref:uncharacterized protein n=1 Tax=Semicossyphus pulcher TaxID=241346 RepID=UPI0037E76C5C
MKAHWWSCVLGLLCMSGEVILSAEIVSQDPLSISLMRVNSSAEITCSTSLPDALGFSLYGQFNNRNIVYLNLDNGVVTKTTIAAEFTGRIQVAPAQQISEGQGFSLQFSLLGLGDTDVYYCSWSYLTPRTRTEVTQTGKGTIILLREKAPKEQCKYHILDHIIIALTVTACTVVLLFFIGALIVRCNRFKMKFRPAEVERTSRATRPPPVSPQQTFQHRAYLNTSADSLDSRGIL